MTEILDDATRTSLRRKMKDIPAAQRKMILALHKDGLPPVEIARRMHERTGVLRRLSTIEKVVERMARRAAAAERGRACPAARVVQRGCPSGPSGSDHPPRVQASPDRGWRPLCLVEDGAPSAAPGADT